MREQEIENMARLIKQIADNKGRFIIGITGETAEIEGVFNSLFNHGIINLPKVFGEYSMENFFETPKFAYVTLDKNKFILKKAAWYEEELKDELIPKGRIKYGKKVHEKLDNLIRFKALKKAVKEFKAIPTELFYKTGDRTKSPAVR